MQFYNRNYILLVSIQNTFNFDKPKKINTMLKHFLKFISTVLILLLLTTFSFAKKPDLFNGKNLDGWKIYGTEKWYVEDGELICESGPDKGYGYLATEKYYKNFELNLEFYLMANGNSGVFFRSTIEGTKISGWQAEVEPTGVESGGIYESYGRGWLIKPLREKSSAQKEGEWNKMKILVVDDKVTTWINGTEMITLSDNKIARANGSIALQIHDGGGIKVKWRKLHIKEL